MAGDHGHHSLALDPALERWRNMTVNRHKYFRWTGRTARIVFAYAIVVPALFGVLAYSTDGKYSLRGKRRGDTIVDY